MLIVQTAVATKKQAERLASVLMKEHLAVCATYFPASSVYFWKGKMVKEKEFVLELKIRDGDYKKVEKRILSLHTYSLPQIIAVPVKKGYSRYIGWAEKQR